VAKKHVCALAFVALAFVEDRGICPESAQSDDAVGSGGAGGRNSCDGGVLPAHCRPAVGARNVSSSDTRAFRDLLPPISYEQ
jgi:hypothetical protein